MRVWNKTEKGKRNEKSEENQEKRSGILPEISCTADPDGCTESDECTGKCVRCVNGRYAGPEFPVRSFACHIDFFCPESLLCGDYDRNNGHGRLFPAESG